jgi:SPP1 family predicted phage head-tail adaptor
MSTVGEKRTRIRIEQQTLVSDGAGGQTTTYTLRSSPWAHERPLTGRETQQAATLNAVLSGVLEIWYTEDISVTDRIVIGTRILQVESYRDPANDRRELHIMVSEKQA